MCVGLSSGLSTTGESTPELWPGDGGGGFLNLLLGLYWDLVLGWGLVLGLDLGFDLALDAASGASAEPVASIGRYLLHVSELGEISII